MDIQALIDADLLRYRIGFVCEKNIIQVFPRGHRDEGPMATFEGKTAYNEWLKNNSDCITEEDLENVCNGMDFGYVHASAIERIGMKDNEIYIL